MTTRLVTSDGTRIAFEFAGNPDGAPLIFLHSLGSSHAQWQPQVEALADTYRILGVDTRGHGASDAPAGDYTLATLAMDVVELADMAGFATFHLCGLSLGGMMAQWIAIHHGHRLRTLTLANTGAKIGTPESWNERAEIARTQGMTPLLDAVLARWFTPAFGPAHPETIDRLKATLATTDPTGYSGCCAALRDADLRAEVPQITAQSLLIASTHDGATPPNDLTFLHANISGSHLHLIEEASHISNIEAPAEFTAALAGHLSQP